MCEENDIEQLIDVLNEATKRFVENCVYKPNYLYLNRKDGEWDAEFRHNYNYSPLAMEMTEWVTGDEANRALALCQCGLASAVAMEIVNGWNSEWDS
jgi:hypothetical protein